MFTALYLKQCSVYLPRYYAQHTDTQESLLIFVSLTRTGIPRIIPPYHRKMIRLRNDKSDRLVRICLSWFSLFKLVQLAPKVSNETFESITKVPSDYAGIDRIGSQIKSLWSAIQLKYLPDVSRIPVFQGMRWVPTWKTLPNSSLGVSGQKVKTNCFTALGAEIALYAF